MPRSALFVRRVFAVAGLVVLMGGLGGAMPRVSRASEPPAGAGDKLNIRYLQITVLPAQPAQLHVFADQGNFSLAHGASCAAIIAIPLLGFAILRRRPRRAR